MYQTEERLNTKRVKKADARVLIIGDGEKMQSALKELNSGSVSISVILEGESAGPENVLDRQEDINLLRSSYSKSLLSDYTFVVLASSNRQLVQQVLKDARQEGVFITEYIHQSHVRLPEQKSTPNLTIKQGEYWKNVASKCLFALAFMLIGHALFSYLPAVDIWNSLLAALEGVDLGGAFGWMLLAGFIAQLVDGMLGMGYGVISTTVLLSTGLNPAAISGSIHTAEMFSSGASGFSHYRFGNINKKLFKTLLIPGVVGAVAGSALLVYLGEEYSGYIRPILSVYTLLLGLRILFNAFKEKIQSRKVKHAGWLAGAGGFLDSFGGGGWGPLVTSTLISKGKTPRFVIGTVSLTEFFVTFASALTFFLFLGTTHFETIAGLIVGGLIAAPIAVRLAGKLPTKTMLIAVSVLVIFSSLRTLLKVLNVF